MKVSFTRLRRSVYAVLALAVAVAATVPAFSGVADAAQVQDRYIKLSSSASGAVAAGQGVSYEVGFKIVTDSADIGGVVVDFCSNSPIIGDSCTAPTGFTVGTPTVATTGGTNTGLGAGWTAASQNSGRTLTLKNATPVNVGAAAQIIFTLSTATNPTNSNTTFYARVFTFPLQGDVDTWVGTANGSSVTGVTDSGGVAMSTAAQVTVTAKVQEQLTFCVYTGANCAAGGTSVQLGNTNGVLSTAGEFVDQNTKFDLASNAADGVTVRFKVDGTLTSGANNIDAIGGTPATSNPGNEQFGFCAERTSGTLLTVDDVYDGSAGVGTGCTATSQTAGTGSTGGASTANFALDTTAATTTYGDDMATMAAGNSETGQLSFIGNIHPTTAAGIYTSTFTFIATGQY
jgi:hypothetical protein